MSIIRGYVNSQDYEILRQLCKKMNSLDPELMDYEIQRFYYEGIFLDLTDCSQTHPRFEVKQVSPSFFKSLFNPKSFLLVRDIVWEVSNTFRLETYFEKEWFSILDNDLNKVEYELMKKSKEDYIKNKITFLEFHLKRCKTYVTLRNKEYINIFGDLGGLSEYESKIKSLYNEYFK